MKCLEDLVICANFGFNGAKGISPPLHMIYQSNFGGCFFCLNLGQPMLSTLLVSHYLSVLRQPGQARVCLWLSGFMAFRCYLFSRHILGAELFIQILAGFQESESSS